MKSDEQTPVLLNSIVCSEAPDFTADAVYPDGAIRSFTLREQRDKYLILLFYPLDFSYLCPAELLAFNKQIEEFRQRNCELAAISVDSVYTHIAFINRSPAEGGIGHLSFPLISDLNKKISRNYGVLLNDSLSLRGLFLLDKQGIVRHCTINDTSYARSIHETLRMIDAVQFHEKYKDVCPVDWSPGEESIEPSQNGLKNYIDKHF